MKKLMKFKGIKKDKIFHIKLSLFLYIYLLLLILHIITSKCYYLSKLNCFSEINITIIGNGTQTILNNANKKDVNKKSYQFNSKPSEILVNGIKVDILDFKVYNLTDEENNITIRWDYPLTFCGGMFYNLTNITKIDVSNFDTSHVTSTMTMFTRCSLLTTLDISNFNLSSVTSMEAMFFGCYSLTSLNFGNLDTSSVTSFYGMFNGCSSLKTLDLSSFTTSSAKTMNGMFYECRSLESLNIQKFDTSCHRYVSYVWKLYIIKIFKFKSF